MSGFAWLPSILHAPAHTPHPHLHEDEALLPHALAVHDEHEAPISHAHASAAFSHVAADLQVDHPTVPPHAQRDAAVDAQVRVSDVDAAVERKGAAGRTQQTADKIANTQAGIQYDTNGKPEKFTTVEHKPDGTVVVTTEIPGRSKTVQTEKTDKGVTTVDETTTDLSPDAHGAKSHRTSMTDGQTTTIDEQVTQKDGTLQLTHDQWRQQTGTDGIRNEVSQGFTGDGQTEVHDHDATVIPGGNVFKMVRDHKTTYSQGNHRVTRDHTEGNGASGTSWTQEDQQGDDYHAQTTFEGHPDKLIQVSRHADRATGTVTEDTAQWNPINHHVESSTHTTRGYDDDGRLTGSDTTAKDKDGTTTTAFHAQYTDNADGTTSVHEDTTTEIQKHGEPTRKTEQAVDATDTKDGRRVDRIRTEVDVDGKEALIATSDGTTTTIQAALDGKASSAQALTFKATGEPADDVTKALMQLSPLARDAALAGLTAVQAGAQASATGVPLVGAFGEHAKDISNVTKALSAFVNPFGGIEDQIGFGFLAGVGFGQDAAGGAANVHTNDGLRLAAEGYARVSDALNVKTILDARALDFDAEAIAKVEAAREATTLGKLGAANDVLGLALGAIQTGNDIVNFFKATNGLDRADAGASAVADGGATALAAASLFLEAGPPGWVVAAGTLGLELAALGVHDVTDDIRRGHPEEATLEIATAASLGLLPAIGLHWLFKDQDKHELREHDLDAAVPQKS